MINRAKPAERSRPTTRLARRDANRANPMAASAALRRFQQALDRLDEGVEIPLSSEQRMQLRRLRRQFSVFTASIAGPSGPSSQAAAVAAKAAANEDRPTAEQLRQAWVDDGLLVSGSVMANAWSRTRQAIDQARTRGELFGVRVKNAYHYPAGFVRLPAEDVKKVNRALRGDDAAAKFIFWTRPHGGANGKTIAALIAEGEVARAIELAQGWSAEHGARAAA